MNEQEIKQIVEKQRTFFQGGATLHPSFRIHSLLEHKIFLLSVHLEDTAVLHNVPGSHEHIYTQYHVLIFWLLHNEHLLNTAEPDLYSDFLPSLRLYLRP